MASVGCASPPFNRGSPSSTSRQRDATVDQRIRARSAPARSPSLTACAGQPGENTVHDAVHSQVDDTMKSWGFDESSGDNPGDSKIPLDLGFRVRECSHSYRRAHANRGREIGSIETDLRVGRRAITSTVHEARAAPDGARSHMLRRTESPGNRRPRAARFPGRVERSTPTARPRRGSGGVQCDGTVYRVSVNGVEGSNGAGRPADRAPTPATGSASAGNRVGDSGNGARFGGNRVGAAPSSGNRRGAAEATEPGSPGRPGLDSGDGGRCDRPPTSGRLRATGSPGMDVSNGSRVGFDPIDWPKTGIARRDPLGGHDGRCDWSRRRLTPEDRPVVDRPTFWEAPGGCAGAGRQHRPGPFNVFRFDRSPRFELATRSGRQSLPVHVKRRQRSADAS